MKNTTSNTYSDDTIISKPTLHQAIEEFSPYLRFCYALNAPESKRQYPKRFKVFLDYLGLDIGNSSIEERINKFYYDYIIKKGNKWLETELCKFFMLQNERAERNEISTQTIPNYYKPIKLFCDMNGISITWKLITKGIKKGQRHSDDRPPSLEEIKKLLEYPDRRIKPIVLVMISSGIRVSSWMYLKWKDFTPIERNDEIVAAKINVFNTKTKKYYYTFCTSEAYNAVKEWMDFRASFGEKITGESDVLRDLWQIKGQRYANYVGLAKHPQKFGYHGIRMLINDAWKIQGVRDELTEGKRRHEFKSLHGFRKFFETECQKVMKSLYVSFLMSHDTGIVQHYHKPKLDELIDNYLLAVDLLTISETNKLSKKITELQHQDDYQKYIIDKKIKEKDEEIVKLRQAMRTAFDMITNQKDNIKELNDRFKSVTSSLFETKMFAIKLEEVDQKKQEMYAKKGFVTKEDEEAIKNSIVEDVKQNDPDLWHMLFEKQPQQPQQ
jgi:integrase